MPRRSVMSLVGWGLVLALLAASWKGADMRPLDLVRDAGSLVLTLPRLTASNRDPSPREADVAHG